MREIFATPERRKILDNHGIKYKVDQSLNLFFESESEKKKAIEILERALEL